MINENFKFSRVLGNDIAINEVYLLLLYFII